MPESTESKWTCTACPFKGPTRVLRRSQDGMRLICPKCLSALTGPVEVPAESPSALSVYLEARQSRSGHWTGVEMKEARYLIAAMTGRTPAEVAEPLSELCHRLRYRPDATEDLCEECGNNRHHCETHGCAMENYYHTESPPGMVVTDLDAWEGEDGG